MGLWPISFLLLKPTRWCQRIPQRNTGHQAIRLLLSLWLQEQLRARTRVKRLSCSNLKEGRWPEAILAAGDIQPTATGHILIAIPAFYENYILTIFTFRNPASLDFLTFSFSSDLPTTQWTFKREASNKLLEAPSDSAGLAVTCNSALSSDISNIHARKPDFMYLL